MAVTRERFEQGMTYAAYKEQMTRNRERLEENERTLELSPADVQTFAQLPKLYALVITEDWCGDAIANVPILARLAEASGNLEVRYFLRDQNLDITDQFLKEGKYRSVPVFAFFDEDFRPIGHWIERPAEMTELMASALDALYAEDPAMQGVERGSSPALMPDAARERITRFYGEFRAQTRARSDAAVVRELHELVTRGLGKA